MITLRRNGERHHDQRRKHEVWLTFPEPDRGDALADGFGVLERLDEERVPPGASVSRRPTQDTEVVTYVREGAIAYADASGRSSVIQAGEFQRATAQRGAPYSETNVSRTDGAHVFQIGLRSTTPRLELGHEQKRFSAAERRGGLCVIASPDGRRGSLRVHQDAVMCSAILERGQHVVHELVSGRGAWLHVVLGEATLNDVILTTGDGVGITAERAVSFTAREASEVLLVDVIARPAPR